jgi:hypothetical protein
MHVVMPLFCFLATKRLLRLLFTRVPSTGSESNFKSNPALNASVTKEPRFALI